MWQPPHPPNGVVTQYDVRLTDSSTSASMTVAVPANRSTQASLSVVQGAEYSVQVRARNGQLVGPYSDPVSFTATFPSVSTSLPRPSLPPASSTLVEPISTETVPPPPPSSTAPTGTAPPTSTMVALPTPSSGSPSPTLSTTADAGELNQQEIIVVVVCCGLIALLLLMGAACGGYIAHRRCRDSPDKSLKYKCKGPWAASLHPSALNVPL